MTLRPTYIAGICDSFPTLLSPILFIYFEAANRSAEHVSRVGEGQQHIIEQAKTAVVTVSHEMLHRAVDVVLIIERFDEVFLAFLLMRVLAVNFLVVHTYVLLLNERGVGEHQRA